MCCEQKLYVCVRMEVPPLRRWCNGSALEHLAGSTGSSEAFLGGGVGHQFPAEPWFQGVLIVLLVKKEYAPKCGGDANNLSFISNCEGLSVVLLL